MDFKIEKGLPIPPGKGRGGMYPFDQMEAGDSFFVADDPGIKGTSVSNSAASYERKHNKKFSVRKVEGGWRCWRVK
jgi:hypothetical protein